MQILQNSFNKEMIYLLRTWSLSGQFFGGRWFLARYISTHNKGFGLSSLKEWQRIKCMYYNNWIFLLSDISRPDQVLN